MNYMDAVCIFILGIYICNTSRKGAVYMIVSLFGKLLSLTASYMYFGTVSRFLRGTPLFDIIKNQAAKTINAENAANLLGAKKEGAGDILISHIIENDNWEIYNLFGVSQFSDYIASYIANTIINIISITLIYFCVSIIISTLIKATGILTKLPVLRQLNKVINIMAGFLQGMAVIWILMVVLMFFVLQGKLTGMYEAVLTSMVAVYFLKYNIFAKIIFSVIG